MAAARLVTAGHARYLTEDAPGPYPSYSPPGGFRVLEVQESDRRPVVRVLVGFRARTSVTGTLVYLREAGGGWRIQDTDVSDRVVREARRRMTDAEFPPLTPTPGGS